MKINRMLLIDFWMTFIAEKLNWTKIGHTRERALGRRDAEALRVGNVWICGQWSWGKDSLKSLSSVGSKAVNVYGDWSQLRYRRQLNSTIDWPLISVKFQPC